MAIKRALVLASMLALAVGKAAIVVHTPVGLGPMHALRALDVAVVRASLAASATTDWHGHPPFGPLLVLEPSPAAC